MAILISALAAFAIAFTTLFTGFGLGTMLMPVLALFFPITTAIAATAVVHGLNNLFKIALLWRHVDWNVVLRFGVPAILAAFAGAWSLTHLGDLKPLGNWQWNAHEFEITPVKLTIGILIAGFALIELSPGIKRLRAAPRWLPVGGLISGYFGGLSGHQGALRTVFILPLGLKPEAFAATQAAIGTAVDLTRVGVYAALIFTALDTATVPVTLLVITTAAAFVGSFIGRRLLTKITVGVVQVVASLLLLVVSAGLISGVI